MRASTLSPTLLEAEDIAIGGQIDGDLSINGSIMLKSDGSASAAYLSLGADNDLKIFHDGDHTQFTNYDGLGANFGSDNTFSKN